MRRVASADREGAAPLLSKRCRESPSRPSVPLGLSGDPIGLPFLTPIPRLVSVFTCVIGPQVMSAKEDTIEARCLVAYNHRKPARRCKRRFDDNVPPQQLQEDYSEDEHWDEEEVLEEGEAPPPGPPPLLTLPR